MKRAIFLVVLSLSIQLFSHAQSDESGDNTHSIYQSKNLLNPKSDIPSISFEFDTVRALTEINEPYFADAYPWISNDGLRLYITINRDSLSKIAYSVRPHTDTLFSEPELLSINSTEYSTISPWLTADELNIYYCINNTETYNTNIYRASRSSINESFGTPVKLTLYSLSAGFFASPSLESDLSKLYIYNTYNGKMIYIYNRAGNDEYRLSDTLSVPEGYEAYPGKLSQDNLKYYLPLKDQGDTLKLHVMQRQSVGESFDSIYF
jgi:hypothetical protein